MQQGWMISADRVRSIADMVGRNARVHSLTLTTDWQGFDPDLFQLVCSGFQHGNNTHLRSLTVDLECIPEGTLDQALAPTSPLEVLHITRGALHEWVTPSLARLLTSNTTLLELDFAERIGNDADPHRLDNIAAALEASNFTLQRFSEGTAISTNREHCHHHLLQDSRIGTCLRRNVWIHRVLHDWPEYQVPFKRLWPTVLHRADSCPTLLYRFVRRGNLPVWCDVAVVVVVRVGGGGRGDAVTKPRGGAGKRKAQG
jgi:hypothetical protein